MIPRTRLAAEDRRALILRHAIEIIGQRGYLAFGLKELGDRCGLTNAGLLHHFGSKHGLLAALLRERDRQDEQWIAETLGDTVTRGATTLDDVQAVLRAVVSRNAGQPELVRLYAMLRAEALGADHPARDFFRRREDATIEIFRDLLAPHVPDASSTARQVAALMNGLEVQWLREDHGFDLVAEWDRACFALLGNG